MIENRPLNEIADELDARAEAEWREVRFWLWARVAMESAAWFAGVLLFHWLVSMVIGPKWLG